MAAHSKNEGKARREKENNSLAASGKGNGRPKNALRTRPHANALKTRSRRKRKEGEDDPSTSVLLSQPPLSASFVPARDEETDLPRGAASLIGGEEGVEEQAETNEELGRELKSGNGNKVCQP